MSLEKTGERSLGILRTIAVIAVLAGAGVSLGLMFHAGRQNNSVLLLLLFAGWVLSPFIALIVVNQISGRWTVLTRLILFCLMLVLTFASVITYSGVLSPPGTKPAFVFLIVPLGSWLLIALFILTIEALSRRKARKGENV